MKAKIRTILAVLLVSSGCACTLSNQTIPTPSATVGGDRNAKIKELKDERTKLQTRIRQINVELSNLRKKAPRATPSALQGPTVNPALINKPATENSGKPSTETLDPVTQAKLLETNRKIKERDAAKANEQDQQEIEAAKKHFE